MIGEFLGELLGGLIGGALGDRLGSRRSSSLEAQGRIFCAVRVIEGQVLGAPQSSEWWAGTADLYAGVIKMEGVRMAVREVDGSSRRPGRQLEGLSALETDSLIVRVAVDGATVEWAVPERQLKWAITVVQAQQESESAAPAAVGGNSVFVAAKVGRAEPPSTRQIRATPSPAE